MATKTIKGMDQLLRKLHNVGDLQKLRPALMAGALHVKGKIAQYPPQRQGVTIKSLGGWKSEKQRRWFFANLREGNIEVPYKRGYSPNSESLGRRWTVRNRDKGLTKIIGNNASYARYVQSAEDQARIHRDTGWVTVEQVIEEESDRVVKFIESEINKILAR